MRIFGAGPEKAVSGPGTASGDCFYSFAAKFIFNYDSEHSKRCKQKYKCWKQNRLKPERAFIIGREGMAT